MADKDIKQRIVLEGEKEYSNALKEAQRNLKVLRSELKAEAAELGKNATEQQKSEAKIKNLNKQIKEQEKVVRTYEKALEEVREKYGDNEEAIAKWEIKLNDARATLANMRHSIEDVGTAFQSVDSQAQMGTVAAKSFADSLGSLATIGESISTSIESVFSGMLGTITSTVEQLWALISDTAAKANSWTDLSAVFGTTATGIEQMYRAISGIGGSGKFDNFVQMMTRLSYGGKEKKIAELLGVSDVNYEDKLDYTMAVMDALLKFQENNSKNKVDDVMSEIFGAKKSADVTWMLENWNAILDKREEYAQKGYNMDADELETMNQVQLQLNDIETKWEALKAKFASGFGTVTLGIQAEVSRGLDALAAYFNAESDEEREAALQEIEESILGVFEVAAKAIEDGVKLLDDLADKLKESENPTAQTLGNIIGGLVDALQWLTEDNMHNVVTALEILAAFWLVGKGAQMASTIASAVANINVIRAFSTGTTAFGGLGTATGGLGIGGLLATAGYIAVGLVMVAPTVQKLFDPNTWTKSETETKIDEVAEEAGMETIKALNEEAGISNQDLLRMGFNRIFNVGDKSTPEKKTDEADAIVSMADTGILIPRAGARKFDLTEAQRSAAEQFWDNYKYYFENPNRGDYSYDKAWDNFEKAFEGDEGTFKRLNDMMERLIREMDSNGVSMRDSRFTDLPAEWWTNQNGLTSEDISGFRVLPNNIAAAVRNGVGSIRVTMDGQAVGRLVAPYVSEQIARDMV